MSQGARTGLALAASVLVHLVLLVAVVVSVRVPLAPSPLTVRLLERPAAPGPGGAPGLADVRRAGDTGLPARVVTEPVGLSAAPLRRPAASPAPRSVVAQVDPVASGEEAAVAPAGGEETGGAPATGGATTAGAGLAGPGTAGEAGAPVAGADVQLRELHRRLAEAAARCYPAAARRLRLQGVVPVRFCLDARGSASALSLSGTTGSALLDRSALECVVPGAEPLAGLLGCFEVPVHFGG